MNELTHLDLFSGIGGFALAAKWNGYAIVPQVAAEIIRNINLVMENQ